MKAFITIVGSASLAAASRKCGILAPIPVSSSWEISISAVDLDHHQNFLYIARLQAVIQVFVFVLDARLLSLHKMPGHAFSSGVPLSIQNHDSNHHYADRQALSTTFNMPSLLTMTSYCVSDPFATSASTYFVAATNEA